MPSRKFSGSWSLCPWCGEEYCPHLHDDDNKKRYWVYATDRAGGYHCMQKTFDKKEDIVPFVKSLVNKKWSKKYRYSFTAKEETAKGWKGETELLPWVELTITDGEYSWYDSVDLLINTEDKTIWYYNKWKTNFSHFSARDPRNIELIKEWDGKLDFIKMQELPWYPTKEEWEARANKAR